MTYRLQGYDENGKPVFIGWCEKETFYTITGNLDLANDFSEYQEALEVLGYLDDLQLMGQFPRVESLCIIDEWGNEV